MLEASVSKEKESASQGGLFGAEVMTVLLENIKL